MCQDLFTWLVDLFMGIGYDGIMITNQSTSTTNNLTNHTTHRHRTGRVRVILKEGRLTSSFRPSDKEAILKAPPRVRVEVVKERPHPNQSLSLKKIGRRFPFLPCPHCDEYQLHSIHTMELGHALWCYCCGWKRS